MRINDVLRACFKTPPTLLKSAFGRSCISFYTLPPSLGFRLVARLLKQALNLNRNRAWVLAPLLLLLFNVGCPKKRDVASLPYMAPLAELSKDAFALVFTASMEGYVEPCGCTSNPLGGIARFTTVFNDIKTVFKNRLALIDAGNLLFNSKTRNDADLCQDQSRIDLLVKTLVGLGLKTTVPGPLDEARGSEFRHQIYQKYALTTDTLHVIKAPLYNIGIVGITDSHKADKNQILEIIKAAKTTHNLKAIILLSQIPISETKTIFSTEKDIDIIIQGQVTNMEPTEPKKLSADGPWLIEGGRQGQFFTALVLQNLKSRQSQRLMLDTRMSEKTARQELLSTRINALKKQATFVDESKKAFIQERVALAQEELTKLQKQSSFMPLPEPNMAFYTVALTKKIDSAKEVKAKLVAYEESIPSLVKKCEANIECQKPAPTDPVYVGVNTCKACHQDAYTVWQQAIFKSTGLDDSGKEITRMVGHSKAWQTLTKIDKDKDRSCIGCHSVGFMEKGGYCKAFEVDFRKDVQCESCHGPGSLHAQTGDKKFIKRKVEEATCRVCHVVPHIASFESFNYEEKLTRILGKGHGERLLKELTHKLQKDKQ